MSAEEQKTMETPVAAAPEGAVAEPTPAAAAEETKPEEKKKKEEEDKPAAGGEASGDKPAETEEAKDEAKEDAKKVEPISSGVLGYKAPGLVKSILFSKKYFFLGEDAISHQNLSRYLRGEKPEVAHPAAAWSSQTGQGLLYFAKRAEDKDHPIGVLKLADAADLTKSAIDEITVKFGTHKHSFQASTPKERDGWFLALEKAVEEAKAAAEEVTNSDGYKEAIAKLGKPSTAATSKPEATPAEGATEERAGSSSSSDPDKKKATEKKSRSLSRGKRASIFGTLLGKKDEVKEKGEEKKDEEEVKKEGGEDTAEASAAAPAAEAAAEDKPAEEDKAAEAPKEEAKEETPKGKAFKRSSIFGSFFDKVKSPTTEKKEADAAPVPPPKNEPAAEAPAEDKPAEESKAEASREEAKEEPKEGPKEEPKEEVAEASTAAPATTPEKRRTSFFSNFGTKKEKKPAADSEGETTEGEKEKKPKLGGLFRNPSKAVKGNKEAKKEAAAPAKVEEEETPAKEETTKPEAKKEETEEAQKEKPKEDGSKPTIGDVVPEAVTVGAPSSTPAVQATA